MFFLGFLMGAALWLYFQAGLIDPRTSGFHPFQNYKGKV
jgi:hypothetical protein